MIDEQTRRHLLKLGLLSAVGAGGSALLPALADTGMTTDIESAREEKSMSLEQIVQRLQDRVEINELLHAYCRYADQLDIENMTAKFTDDCVVAYVPKEMAPAFRGKAALKKFLSEYFPNSVSSSHHIDNVELLFDSADQVTGHTYMYSFQRFKGFPAIADCHRWGRYELRLVRTAAGWRVSRMKLLSAAEYGGARIGEQFGRPWPPRFD